MSNKTLIVGDVHLGKSVSIGKPGVGNALNSRIADQIALLDWILEQTQNNNVDTLILTGDIFEDVKPDYVLVNIFFQFLKKCEDLEIETHIILGNHDLRRTGNHYNSVLDLIETSDISNVFVHKQINTIIKDKIAFTLMPFRDRRSLNSKTNQEALALLQEKLPYEIAEIPSDYKKVLIGHLALEGSLYVGDEIDDYANELICPLNMFAGFDYVWMGHVHRPQVLSRSPNYLAHIGSLDLSDFGETDHTKILILIDSDGFTEIPVPSRPLRKISFSIPEGFETTEYVLEQIKVINENKSFKDAIVKIEIKLNGSDMANVERNKIEELIYKLGASYISNFSESRNIVIAPLQDNNINSFMHPKAAIKMYAEQLDFSSDEEKEEYIKLSIELLERVESKN